MEKFLDHSSQLGTKIIQLPFDQLSLFFRGNSPLVAFLFEQLLYEGFANIKARRNLLNRGVFSFVGMDNFWAQIDGIGFHSLCA